MTRPTRAGSYRAVLRLPGVLRVFPAAVLGRLSYATVSLSLLLTVERATGSFAAAGAALGGYAVTSLAMPAKSRLIDRFGQRRVLPLLSGGFAAVLVVLVTAASAGLHEPTCYVVLAAAAGLVAAPLGPSMRARWAALTPEPAARQRAYSLDGVVEETLFAVGPLLVGSIIAVSSAAAALLLTAALNLAGTVGMASVPVIGAPVPAPPRSSASGSRWSVPPSGSGSPSSPPRRWTGPFHARGFALLVAALFGIGLGGGPLEVSVVARAQQAGHPGAAGSLFAALSVGSVVGGLLWGQLRHHRAVSLRLGGLVAVMAIGSVAAGLAPGLPVLAVVLVLAGSAGSPAFTVAYLAADDLVPAAGRTEASTWVNTANNVGLALGAAAAGVVVDRLSAAAALISGGVVLAGMATFVLATGSRLDGHRDG